MEKTLTYDSDSYGGDPVYCTKLYIPLYFTVGRDGEVEAEYTIETEDGVTVGLDELSDKEQAAIVRMVNAEKEHYEMVRG